MIKKYMSNFHNPDMNNEIRGDASGIEDLPVRINGAGSVVPSLYLIDERYQKQIVRRMNAISDIYKELIDYLSDILEFIQKYSHRDVKIWENAKNNFKQKTEKVKELMKYQTDDVGEFIQTMSDMHILMEDVDKIISEMITIMNNPVYTELLLYNMSQTYGRETISKANNIRNMHSEYSKVIVNSEGEKILEYLYEIIKPGENISVLSIYVDNVVFINNFLVYVTKRVVKERESDDSNVIKKFILRIEKLKNLALKNAIEEAFPDEENSISEFVTVKDLPTLQQLTLRHGLFPVSEFYEFKELFEYFGSNYDFDHSVPANMKQLANKLGMPVVILHFEARKLVEFNILPLVDKEYVKRNELETSSQSGLNNRIIRRFNTIKEIKMKDLKSPAKTDNIEIYTNGNDAEGTIVESDDVKSPVSASSSRSPVSASSAAGTSCTILQCINWKQYRALSNNLESKSVSIDYLSKIKNGLTTRPHNYNRIIEKAILDKGIYPGHRNIMIGYESAADNALSSEKIKNTLRTKSIEYFIETYRRTKNISSPKDMEVLIAGEDTIEAITTILTDELAEVIIKPNSAKSLELNFSFVANLDIILTKFKKEYNSLSNELFASGKIIKIRFNEMKGKVLEEYIVGWFKDILEKAMGSLETKPVSLDDMEMSLKEYVITQRFINV